MLFRVSVDEGELCFYDLILAWSRIIRQKYLLCSGGVLMGCGLNELLLGSEFDLSAGSINDYYVSNVDVWLNYEHLPWPDESIDFLVSTHLFEPGVTLGSINELSRVLSVGGYILIFNLCKFSCLSLQKFFSSGDICYPNLVATNMVRKALKRNNMTMVLESAVSFRPLVARKDFDRLVYLEFLGATIMPYVSSCSLVLARKDDACLINDFRGAYIG